MNNGIGVTARDLGEFDDDLLVFGGPYSNLEATRALRAEAAHSGIPPERCICTGDVVAYCASPAETVAEIRDWGCAVVMGNCEESLAAGVDDCGCGFEEGSACDTLSREWFSFASSRLGDAERAWMGGLPRRLDLRLGGLRWAVVHGGVGAISRFVFESSPDTVFAEEFDRAGTDAVLAGHCGLPFARALGARLWVNAGVIGMPADDGVSRTWYARVQPAPGQGVRVGFHRLDYPAKSAARRMHEAGLARAYADALVSGRWPGLDVLPSAERRNSGCPPRASADFLWSGRGPVPGATARGP